MSQYCKVVNNQCLLNHCHLCNKETNSGQICRECVLLAREGWLEHYWNHVSTNEPNPDCGFCKTIQGLSQT